MYILYVRTYIRGPGDVSSECAFWGDFERRGVFVSYSEGYLIRFSHSTCLSCGHILFLCPSSWFKMSG